MKQIYLPGHDKLKKIEVIESEGEKHVVLNGRIFMSWASWDNASQRMAIVQLYKSKIGTQQDLARAFGIHINSVQKYIVDFTKGGVVCLFRDESGIWSLQWIIVPQILP